MEKSSQGPVFCRICFQKNCATFISIFQKLNDDLITALLKELSGEMLLIDNTIPNVICTVCVQNLSIAVTLRRQLSESEHQFRTEMFKGLNIVETDELGHTDTKKETAIEEASVDEAVLKTIENCISELSSSVQIERVPFLFNEKPTKSTINDLPAKITISNKSSLDEASVREEEKQNELDEYIDLRKSAVMSKNYVLSEIDENTCLENVIINFVEGPKMHWNEPSFEEPINFKVSKKFNSAPPKKTVIKVNFLIDELKVDFEKTLKSGMDISAEVIARSCCMCKTVCPTPDDLLVHIESHEERKNNIVTNQALGVDIILKNGTEKIICQLCHRIFRREITYLFHLKKQYLPLKSICEHCGKAFVTTNLLNKHIRGNHRESNFEQVPCSVCAKLVLRRQLKVHERSHEKKPTIGRFKCQICPKVYRNKYQLKFHVMSHVEFKPFECTLCSKKFTIAVKLKTHMRVHNNDRSFTCPYCDKTFIHHTDRSRHIKVHTGERPHACQVCSQAYIKKYDLTQHMLKNHPFSKPFKCDLCAEAFIHDSELKQHKLRDHYENH